MTMVEERCPTDVLQRFKCECGKVIGEIDFTQPHTERKWCRDCKTWTVIVVREASRARVH